MVLKTAFSKDIRWTVQRFFQKLKTLETELKFLKSENEIIFGSHDGPHPLGHEVCMDFIPNTDNNEIELSPL